MAFRHDTLSLITSEFPGCDALIKRTYRESSSFRDLCQDYRRCAAALERWRESDGDTSSSRAREYAELLTELAIELESWLKIIGNHSIAVSGTDLK